MKWKMNTGTTRIALLACILILSGTSRIWSLSGPAIMQRTRRLTKPLSSRGTVKLVIKNRGMSSSKIFTILSKKSGGTTYSRINFLRPTRLQFLIHSMGRGNARQWIKLSSGRIRRIASGNRKSRWAGSHFYYEDLQTYSLDSFRFRRLADGTVASYKKKTIPCYRVEAKPKKGGAVYSKRIIFIEKGTWKIRRVQFFERGRQTKTLTNYLYKNFSGIHTPRLVYMEPAGGGGNHSYLLIQKIAYNIPLSLSLFRRSSF